MTSLSRVRLSQQSKEKRKKEKEKKGTNLLWWSGCGNRRLWPHVFSRGAWQMRERERGKIKIREVFSSIHKDDTAWVTQTYTLGAKRGQWLKASMSQNKCWCAAGPLDCLKLFLHPTAVTALCREGRKRKTLHLLIMLLGSAIHQETPGNKSTRVHL